MNQLSLAAIQKKRTRELLCAHLKMSVLETGLKPETKLALELTYALRRKLKLNLHCTTLN